MTTNKMGACQSASTAVETPATAPAPMDKNTTFVLTLAERNKLVQTMTETRLNFERSFYGARERHLASLRERIDARRADAEYAAKEAALMRELDDLIAADEAAKQAVIQANVDSI